MTILLTIIIAVFAYCFMTGVTVVALGVGFEPLAVFWPVVLPTLVGYHFAARQKQERLPKATIIEEKN